MFKSTTTINKEVLDEVKLLIITKKARIRSYLQAIGFLVLAGLALFIKEYLLAFIMVVLAVFSLYSPTLKAQSTIDKHLERLRELYGSDDVSAETSFQPDGIEIKNLSSGGQVKLNYKSIERFEESANYFILMTGADQFTLVNKKDLSSQQLNEFVPYLKGRNTGIKW